MFMRVKSKRKQHKKRNNHVNPAYEKLFEDRAKAKEQGRKRKMERLAKEEKVTIEYKKADGTVIARRSGDSKQGLGSESS
jgi:hypothetical protein